MRNALRDHALTLPPTQLERMIVKLSEHWRKANAASQEVALLCDSSLRRPLRRTIERSLSDLPVVAYTEIPADMLINAVAMLRNEDIQPEEQDNTSRNQAA